jgi:hypothetical protein
MRLRQQALFHAQIAKDRPINRVDEITTELFSGEYLLIDQDNGVTAARQRNGGGRARRTGADDGDVKDARHQCENSNRAVMRNGNTEISRK